MLYRSKGWRSSPSLATRAEVCMLHMNGSQTFVSKCSILGASFFCQSLLPEPEHKQSYCPLLCDHALQTMLPDHVIMLPDHVIMLPRPCSLGHVTTSHTIRQSPSSHMHTLSGSHHPPTCTHHQAVTFLPHAHTLGQSPHHTLPHAHTFGQSPPSHMHTQEVTTLPHAHSQAVTTLPHAPTIRQSPSSHMHTLLGSPHPPTCTHFRTVPTLPHAHSGSHHPPTCTHSQAVPTLPCHVIHTIMRC